MHHRHSREEKDNIKEPNLLKVNESQQLPEEGKNITNKDAEKEDKGEPKEKEGSLAKEKEPNENKEEKS